MLPRGPFTRVFDPRLTKAPSGEARENSNSIVPPLQYEKDLSMEDRLRLGTSGRRIELRVCAQFDIFRRREIGEPIASQFIAVRERESMRVRGGAQIALISICSYMDSCNLSPRACRLIHASDGNRHARSFLSEAVQAVRLVRVRAVLRCAECPEWPLSEAS